MTTFLYDWDDTLMPNLVDYYDAQLKFLEWVRSVHGTNPPPIDALIMKLNQIDSAAVKQAGFSQNRFPNSMMLAYQEMCSHLPGYTADNLRIAYEIGKEAFDAQKWKRTGLTEGAAETLDDHLERGDELILLTKGDPFVQISKLQAVEARRWFGEIPELLKGDERGTYQGSARILITPDKPPGLILYVIGLRNPDQVYLVGNSVRSDILPALQAGIKAIWIPSENWDFERQHPDLPETDRAIPLKNISEIRTRHDQLFTSS